MCVRCVMRTCVCSCIHVYMCVRVCGYVWDVYVCADTGASSVCVHMFTHGRVSVCMCAWLACIRVHAGVQRIRYLWALCLCLRVCEHVHVCTGMYSNSLRVCVCVCVCGWVCVGVGWLCASLDKTQVKALRQGWLPHGRPFGGHAAWGCHWEMRSSTEGQGSGNRRWSPTPRGSTDPVPMPWTQKALMLLRPWE